MPKYSTTPFDQAALDEFDQKDKLFKMISESKSYNKHPAHKALYDALTLSLSVDEDDIDKQLEDPPTQMKRHQDDQDQDPQADAEKRGKERMLICRLLRKVKLKASHQRVLNPHLEHLQLRKLWIMMNTYKDGAVDDAEIEQDADMAAYNTPDLEWHKEPNDALEQSWFNDMVNTEKGSVTFDDIMDSVVDFTKFTKNCLQNDKIMKVDLEGPAFKLLKGNYKKYIELEYNFKQCYLALTDQIDWINPQGGKIPYDLSKPLPLQGPLGRTTILVDFFFNKDLEYLKNEST
ncbi:hypothetical protein Tco_0821152 [Tanacetum coccineum]|uniref:Uncharacterized protein n=1 Tax=Tanacetum coccineum TaxID=301880 RepID=A0ABQ5AFK0_9ASTR